MECWTTVNRVYNDVHHTYINAENISRQLGPVTPTGIVSSEENRWKSTGGEIVHRADVQQQ